MPHHARAALVGLIAMIAIVGAARPARAQLGALLSPGRLARAHSDLEGLTSCTQCHERGRRVTPQKCLTCHQPIADRIAMRKGIHKDAADGCIACHVDHAGVDGNLRPFDTAAFDHAGVAGFALDNKHAPVAAQCASCHKARSFLTADPSCAACHDDVHKSTLGLTCDSCHSAGEDFTAARASFDHSGTPFPLSGAHRTTACTGCHVDQTFTTARRFDSCSSCHRTPHSAALSATCTNCHSNRSWRTTRFDHDTTTFGLAGMHATVDCVKCHVEPATRVTPPSDTCATCHSDTHRGEFTQDCAACHDETGFAGAAFDHTVETTFALAEGHAGLGCVDCHATLTAPETPLARKALDFRGLQATCAVCHDDPHDAELGPLCETCHSPTTFRMTAFAHPRFPEFFAGRHTSVDCVACHTPVPASPDSPPPSLATAAFRNLPSTCASCHEDVHLGQVGTTCETCHSLDAEHFAADRFVHDDAGFQLEGRHALERCENCHREERAMFPAGPGTAVRLNGIESSCVTCHEDVHAGQVSQQCETCHGAESFVVTDYRHQSPPRGFFEGRHEAADCTACHVRETAVVPAGGGRVLQFDIDIDCTSCHTDPHNGSLGRGCINCHKPEPLRPAHVADSDGPLEGTTS